MILIVYVTVGIIIVCGLFKRYGLIVNFRYQKN